MSCTLHGHSGVQVSYGYMHVRFLVLFLQFYPPQQTLQVSYGLKDGGREGTFFLATELIEGVHPDPALRDAAAHAHAVKVRAVLVVGGFSLGRWMGGLLPTFMAHRVEPSN